MINTAVKYTVKRFRQNSMIGKHNYISYSRAVVYFNNTNDLRKVIVQLKIVKHHFIIRCRNAVNTI